MVVSTKCDFYTCVNVSFLEDGQVAVNDTKNPDGPTLVFTKEEWDAFIEGAKNGEFDYLTLESSRG